MHTRGLLRDCKTYSLPLDWPHLPRQDDVEDIRSQNRCCVPGVCWDAATRAKYCKDHKMFCTFNSFITLETSYKIRCFIGQSLIYCSTPRIICINIFAFINTFRVGRSARIQWVLVQSAIHNESHYCGFPFIGLGYIVFVDGFYYYK